MAPVKHGHYIGDVGSKTYVAWRAMKQRCYDENNISFKFYGGRGIIVCDRWLNSFESFLADMGEAPEGKSLDRYPDNDGSYAIDNCRWATAKQQAENRRNSDLLTAFGKCQTVSEWARELGVSRCCIQKRIKKGWSPEKTVSVPSQMSRSKSF